MKKHSKKIHKKLMARGGGGGKAYSQPDRKISVF